MLVDLILDRKDGFGYSAKELYNYCMCEFPTYYEEQVAKALDGGTEQDVKRVLCEYIMSEYNPAICEYIMSVDWLVDEYGNKIN